MSINGIATFEKNLRVLMASDGFKNTPSDRQLQLGGILLRSRYGMGSFLGFGRVEKLKPEPTCVKVMDK